jgi:hypothetical protein
MKLLRNQLCFFCFFVSFFVTNAQTPGNVPANLQLWYKSNLGLAAGPVSTWRDQSSNNFDINQATAAAQPSCVTQAINFNPCVAFDGVSDYLPIAGLSYNGLNALNGLVSFVVFKSAFSAGNYNNNWAFLDFDRSEYFNVYLHGNGGLGFSYNASGINDNTSNTTGFNDGIPHIGVALYDNTVVEDTKLYTDGLLDYSADRKPTGTTIGSNTTRFGFLGDGSESNGVNGNRNDIFYTGDIAEVLYYDVGTLSANEINRIHAYLAIKYGITLGNALNPISYLNSSNGSIWAADPVFQHHIAGLVRDDMSALNQLKSKSEAAGSIVQIDKNTNFSNDLQAIVWGSNNAVANFSTLDAVPGYNQRLERSWKVDLTASPGLVNVRFVLPNSGNLNHYALLTDADGVFGTGASILQASSVEGDTITFNDVLFLDGQFFSLAQKDFAPGNVANDLALWYRADVGVQEGSVDLWNDFSGNNYQVIQATTASQPSRVSNQINFNPSLVFDGTDDYLPISDLNYSNSNGLDGLASFVVFKSDFTGPNYNNNWSFLDFDRSEFFNFYLNGNGRLSMSYYAGAVTDITAARLLNDNVPHLGVAVYDNAVVEDTKIYADGLMDFSADRISTGVPIGRTTTRFGFIGDGSEAGSFDAGRNNIFYQGAIAELILYDAASLSDIQLDQVQSYLAIKYGITLGNSINPVAYRNSSAAIIWPADPVFQHDVAGIARDDASSLDQRRSLSVNTDAAVSIQKNVFPLDQSYLLWGNDNAALNLSPTDVVPGFESRLERRWKVAQNGAVGSLRVAVIFPNTTDISRYALHTDIDGVFASGAIEYPASSVDGDTLFFDNVSLTDGMFFSLSKKTDIAPGAVTNNLQLWLKANDGPSCDTDGCNVADWTDRSTNLNDLAQGNIGFRPVFKNNLADNVNYNPVIDFDGIDDFLIDVTGVLGNNTYNNLNIYSVVITDAISASFFFEEPCSPRRISMHIPWVDNNFYWDAGDAFTNYRLATNWSSSINVPYLWSNLFSTTSGITLPGTAQAIRRNGLNLATDNTASPFTGTNAAFFFGKSATGNPFNSRVAEFALYAGPVDPVEHQKIESYLGIKYGITLSNVGGVTAGDYLAANGSTIWDASLFSDYHHQVIGIARDDAQGLLQKQSKSSDDSIRIYIDDLAPNNSTNLGVFSDDNSYLLIGSDLNLLSSTAASKAEMPPFVLDRIEREWKVTNNNFNDTYNIEIKWDLSGPFDLSVIRLLVDDDGDFSNATVLGPATGLTFSLGSIIISGINTSHIPLNSTRFITVGFFDRDLPVELLDFRAEAVNNQVALNWTTASETNNDYFVVERSKNGVEWEPVAQVEGHGNSLTQRFYQSYDIEPYQGLSYYRLGQIDFDATLSYSHSIAVQFTHSDFSELTIYPNPTKNELTIKANNDALESCRIFSILGQDLTHLVPFLEQTIRKIRLDLSKLETGIYLIRTKRHVHKIYKE